MAGSEDRTIPDLPKANKESNLLPGQESFNEAMNPPNNPKKDKAPTSYNVNNDYPYFDEPFA